MTLTDNMTFNYQLRCLKDDYKANKIDRATFYTRLQEIYANHGLNPSTAFTEESQNFLDEADKTLFDYLFDFVGWLIKVAWAVIVTVAVCSFKLLHFLIEGITWISKWCFSHIKATLIIFSALAVLSVVISLLV